ncbi:helix-turn-helix transcriptional regulator [Sphingobacteriaceae bacterium WQ 2009]|uniref:Helix-turn-helix transcriptional regulator n=2 Tax=Rhinopithecimicrobium faecis TaxID=2820698 RepID=A0A8T4H9M7_9SPHI|nr:helix-turn-helix transcriptional regulator [Sphingobacteriaceae bacterium WQ 2009]
MIKKPITDPEVCTGNIRAMTDALESLGGKWRLLILHYLLVRADENNTFNKIEKDIEGISAKMLSKELKILESNLLVSREVQQSSPVTVKYNITEYGKQVRPVIAALVNWGLAHRMEVFQ